MWKSVTRANYGSHRVNICLEMTRKRKTQVFSIKLSFDLNPFLWFVCFCAKVIEDRRQIFFQLIVWHLDYMNKVLCICVCFCCIWVWELYRHCALHIRRIFFLFYISIHCLFFLLCFYTHIYTSNMQWIINPPFSNINGYKMAHNSLYLSRCHVKMRSHEGSFFLHLLANKIFQYRTFASRLSTHYSNLRQVQCHMYSERCKRVLQLVYDRNQALHTEIGRHDWRTQIISRFYGWRKD